MSNTGYAPILTTIAAAGLCALLQPAHAQSVPAAEAQPVPPAAAQARPPAAAQGVTPRTAQQAPRKVAQNVPKTKAGPGAATPAQFPPDDAAQRPAREEGIEADLPKSGVEAPPGQRDTAANKTTITSDAIQSGNSQSTQDALRDVPGLASTDTRGSGTGESLQVRGIKLNSTTSYRLDGGLPMVNNIVMSLEDKQNVQALKGAGALQFGLASAGGMINYTMKRAGNQPNASFTTQFNNYGQEIGALDIGRRFGPDNQLGIRLNAAGGEIGTFVPHAGGPRYLAGIAADWKPSDRVSFLFDYENFGINVIEQGSVVLNPPVNNKIILPSVPSATKLRSGTWALSSGYGENIMGRGQVDLGSGFEVISDLGRSKGWRWGRSPTQIGNYNVVTGLGRGNATLIQNQLTENKYANVELHHTSTFGPVTNQVVFGGTYNQRDFNGPQSPVYNFPQNIYSPFFIPPPPASLFPGGKRVFLPDNSWDWDGFFRDQIDLFQRIHLVGGIRRIWYEADSIKPSGQTLKTQTRFDAPGFGAVVDIIPAVSVYASYMKSLDETGQAPVSAANAYAVLPPAPATQKEVGIRLNKLRGSDFTIGYFNINRGNATTDPVTNIFALNGTVTYEGVETTAVVPLGGGVVLNGGAQYMHATQVSPHDPTINNKAPENTPVWSGSGGITWRPAGLPGLRLNVGMLATGPREANPQNQAKLPGFMIFNAGASYATELFGHRTSFNLTASNILNHTYWSTVSTGQLGIGTPLTVAFSIRTEL